MLSDELIQELYNRSFDLMLFVQMLTGRRRKLDYLAKEILGVGKYKDNELTNSGGVPRILREGSASDVKRVWKYTLKDVGLLMTLYRRLNIDAEFKLDYWQWQIEQAESFLKNIVTNGKSDVESYYDPI